MAYFEATYPMGSQSYFSIYDPLIYTCKADLTAEQVAQIEAVFHQAIRTRRGLQPNDVLLDKLWAAVFEGWASDSITLEPPYPKRTVKDTTTKAGIFKEGLPVAKSGIIHPERQAGRNAYLRIYLNNGQYPEWHVVDGSNRLANYVYVDFADSMLGCITKAMRHYDCCELVRLCQWNSALAVHIARQYIQEWAYPAWGLPMRRPIAVVAGGTAPEIGGRGFEKITLCRDALAEKRATSSIYKALSMMIHDPARGDPYKDMPEPPAGFTWHLS